MSSTPNETPLNLDIRDQTIKLRPPQKRKSEDEITQNIFKCTTVQETNITKSILCSFKVCSASLNIQSANKKATININTSSEDLATISSFSDAHVQLDLQVGEKNLSTEYVSSIPAPTDYVHYCLQKVYPGLLKNQEYEEINSSALKMLNQDWKNKPYLRIACGQLSAGSVFVEGNEALLVNCIELHNRKPSVDPHYERFGSQYMVHSGPSLNNLYGNLNIISKVEDKSKKLEIGTLVFNILVTSSVR